LPVVVSFAEENHPPFHKNFFVLRFRLPVQAVEYLMVAKLLYLHKFFHITHVITSIIHTVLKYIITQITSNVNLKKTPLEKPAEFLESV